MHVRNSAPLDASGFVNHGRKPKAPRKCQILAAAFEEFAANGYAVARLDNVAKLADIAKGTIYLYFKSKSRLFRAVVQGLIHPVFEDFNSFASDFSGSASELLEEMISRQYAEVVMNRKVRAILRLLIAESGKFPKLSENYHREVIEPGVTAMRLVLEKGIASGELRETAIADFPQVLAAPSVLAVVWILILGQQALPNLNAYRAAHVEFALSGLRKKGDFEAHAAETSTGSGEGT